MARKSVATSSSGDASLSSAARERLIASRCSAASGPKYDTASACSAKKRSRSASMRSTTGSSRVAVGEPGTSRGPGGRAAAGRANGERAGGRGDGVVAVSGETGDGGAVADSNCAGRSAGEVAAAAEPEPAGAGNNSG